MKTQVRRLECLFRSSTYLGLIMVFVVLGSGCTTTKETTKTQTTVTYPDQVKSSDAQKDVVVESQTTTTTTQDKSEKPGILSSTFHAIGYVLALPFIIVGGFFTMIFGG